MAIKHAFKRLLTLDPAIQEAVRTKLLNGETPSSVSVFLQKECQVLLDIKPASLKKNLERYRAADLKNQVVNDIVDKVRGKNTANTHKQFVALNELEQIAIIQKDRVMKLVLKEASLPGGVLLKQTSDETRLFKEILVELGKMQLETGIGMKRAPKAVSGSVTDVNSGETREFTWTEEAQGLLNILDSDDYKVLDEKAA